MGVDTKILVSYGILIPVQHGMYLQTLLDPEYADYLELDKPNDSMDKLTEHKWIEYINENIEFSSDAYVINGNNMFIHLQSCSVELFNARTGGGSGYGKHVSSEMLRTICTRVQDITEEEKDQFNTFCNFVLEKIKNKFPYHYSEKDYEPNVFVYYYNW
jgi:hypothetical protein